MQKGHFLQFCCPQCQHTLEFSVFEIEKQGKIPCACSRIYDFSDEKLLRQIRKFEDLCRQIQKSEEILSHTSVGIHIGDREIKIPYKLLLTRLNSTLELFIGNNPVTIIFRVEPILDLQE